MYCMQPSSPHPPPSAFRVHTYVYVARAKVTVSRSFFQCHVIQEKHISCGCDDVTFLLAVSDNWSAVRVRLRHIHVKKKAAAASCPEPDEFSFHFPLHLTYDQFYYYVFIIIVFFFFRVLHLISSKQILSNPNFRLFQ